MPSDRPRAHSQPPSADPLARFSPATRAWFGGAFPAPTAAQAGAWDTIGDGRNVLVEAPTGSGKTLAAFLWCLDRLAFRATEQTAPAAGCRVVYVSPLKALAVDIERNLRSPLAGIRNAATRLDLPVPDIRVAMRSGDTPADERRLFARRPADILITTPESLFLLLTSAARAAGEQPALVSGGVAGTHRHPDVRYRQVEPGGGVADPGQWRTQVALDVHRQRFQRADIDHAAADGRCGLLGRPESESVQAPQEGRQRLAGTGGGLHQHVAAVADRVPGTGLGRGGRREGATEPRPGGGGEARQRIRRRRLAVGSRPVRGHGRSLSRRTGESEPPERN